MIKNNYYEADVITSSLAYLWNKFWYTSNSILLKFLKFFVWACAKILSRYAFQK